MKKLIAIFCLFIATGCLDSSNYDYEFYINDLFFEIAPGMNTIETHVFVIEDARPFLDAYLSNQGNSTSSVRNIAAGRATLTGRYNGVDMGLFREVRVRLVDKNDRNDYQEIFQRVDIPLEGEFNLSLDPTLADIKRFIEQDEVNVEVRVRFRRLPQNYIPMQLDFSYAVIL